LDIEKPYEMKDYRLRGVCVGYSGALLHAQCHDATGARAT